MLPFQGVTLEPPPEEEEGQVIEVALDEVGPSSVIPDGQSFSVVGRGEEDHPVYGVDSNTAVGAPLVNQFDSEYVATNSQVYSSRQIML